jgi:hypothetical protein
MPSTKKKKNETAAKERKRQLRVCIEIIDFDSYHSQRWALLYRK